MKKIEKYREGTKLDFERVSLMKELKNILDSSDLPLESKDMALWDMSHVINNRCITCGSKTDDLGVNKTGICLSCYNKLNDQYKWFFDNHTLL